MSTDQPIGSFDRIVWALYEEAGYSVRSLNQVIPPIQLPGLNCLRVAVTAIGWGIWKVSADSGEICAALAETYQLVASADVQQTSRAGEFVIDLWVRPDIKSEGPGISGPPRQGEHEQ